MHTLHLMQDTRSITLSCIPSALMHIWPIRDLKVGQLSLVDMHDQLRSPSPPDKRQSTMQSNRCLLRQPCSLSSSFRIWCSPAEACAHPTRSPACMHDVRLRWKRARPGSERLINVCVWTVFEVHLHYKLQSDKR